MITMICDFCRKPSQCWEFKKKFNIFKRWPSIDGTSKDHIDVCDDYVTKIIKAKNELTN